VRNDVKAQLAAAGEHPGEELGWAATLTRVEADTDEVFAVRQRLFECCEGILFSQMA